MDIPRMMLHDDNEMGFRKDDEIYKTQYQILEDSLQNISLTLLNFPSEVNEDQTKAVEYVLDFMRFFNVRMAVRCQTSNTSSETSDHPKEDSAPVEVEIDESTSLLPHATHSTATSSKENLFTAVADGCNDQDRPIPSTITKSTATVDVPKHTETSFDEREPLDEDVEKEIIEIEKKPLENLPGKYAAFRSLKSNVSLIEDWLQSFPYTNSKNQVLNLDAKDEKYIYNAVHGGGNAAYKFFEIFKIRRGNREIRYLREILEKKKEDFREAINVLMVYTDIDMISDIKIGDIAKLADSTTHISTDGANLAVEDWKYIADKSGLMEVVDSCQASRRNRGVDGRGAAMFQIIEQRFPEYLISDFLKVFENAKAHKFVKDLLKKIREKAKDNVKDMKR